MREYTPDNLNQIAKMIILLQEAEAETGLTIDGSIIINDDEDSTCLGEIVGNDSSFLFVPC